MNSSAALGLLRSTIHHMAQVRNEELFDPDLPFEVGEAEEWIGKLLSGDRVLDFRFESDSDGITKVVPVLV